MGMERIPADRIWISVGVVAQWLGDPGRAEGGLRFRRWKRGLDRVSYARFFVVSHSSNQVDHKERQ